MAFVVAIAGIIFPAISTISPWSPRGKRLMSNLDLVGMEKIVERMFEVAATKSSVSTSSLSNDRTCTASSV